MKAARVYALVTVCCKSVATSTSTFCSADSVKHFPNEQTEECALYMAESSIPGAGLGLFTAVDLAEGDKINEPELLLPLIRQGELSQTALNDHVWTGVTNQMPFDAKADISFPGIGSHINCHQGLINTVMGRPKVDSAGLHRGKDPGAGAFSYYHSMHIKATTSIEAGSELFIAYGDGLEPSETCMGDDEELKTEDYEVANEVMGRVLYSEARAKRGKDNFVLNSGSWNLIRELVLPETKELLPERFEDLHHASSVGAARFSLPDSIREADWLRENGMCVDNMYPDKSTVQQGGRGAFAKRFLPAGSVVSPAPVIHIGRGKLNSYYPPNQRKNQEQIHLNYSFGHPKSSILLLPHAPVVNFINHNSKEANVRIRWSANEDYQNADWLTWTPEELIRDEFVPGLMIEYVALRDIEAGEEIFLDYGPAWEHAWSEHVAAFSPTVEAENYVSASTLLKSLSMIKTKKEQKEDPYPKNVWTACYYRHVGDSDEEALMVVDDYDWDDNMACLRPCKIISRSETYESGEKDYLYTAEMGNSGYESAKYCVLPEETKLIIQGIPSGAVTIMDRPYTMDQHLPWAFRHEIGVPKDFYPSNWLDL